MSGLEQQMGGMGTAFSSSLLGLAGSLVVGILELFASQAQNQFYRELEEWLSSITRLGTASEGENAGADGLNAVAEILDSLAEQMDGMRALQAESEAGRGQLDQGLATLAEAVDRLSLRFEMESSTAAALMRLAEGQERLVAVMEGQQGEEDEPHIEAETRMRLRSMDVQLVRILEELSAGRQESMAEMRSDLAMLTQAVRQLNRQAPPSVGPEGSE
jgi:uncharacterized phage infection (PIP) family protein YhgE